jgi:hypothetical protein
MSLLGSNVFEVSPSAAAIATGVNSFNGASADGRNVWVMRAIVKKLCGRYCLICTVIALNKDNYYASRGRVLRSCRHNEMCGECSALYACHLCGEAQMKIHQVVMMRRLHRHMAVDNG